MNEKPICCDCRLWTGCSPQSVADLLDQRLAVPDLPVLVSREPVDRRRRSTGSRD